MKQNNMNKLLSAIGLLAVGVLISSIVILPFSVYVIFDVAKLFNVERITIIPKEAIYGLMIIISIVTAKLKNKNKEDKDEEKDIAQTAVKMFVSYAETALFLLIVWGISYVVHAINF